MLPLGGAFSIVSIIGCGVQDFTGSGIEIEPTPKSGSTGSGPYIDVLIADSFVLKNATNGISIAPQGAFLSAETMIDRTVVSYNGTNADSMGAILVDVRAVMNRTAALSIKNASFVTVKHSTLQFTISAGVDQGVDQFDILNKNGMVFLDDANTIQSIYNVGSGAAMSDGTNNIGTVEGNPLTTVSRN